MYLLAEAIPGGLPDPNHFASIGWLLVGFLALLKGADWGIKFWKEHIREQPSPSKTYLTLTAHLDYKKELNDDIKDIKEMITALGSNFEESKRYQAKARKEIHQRMNKQENALYYMAGKEESQGNTHAARVIRERLGGATPGEEDHG